MPNSIHIFGDSFSTGYPLTSNHDNIPNRYKPYGKYTWSTAIQNHLPNYKCKNYAASGQSNETLPLLILDKLSSIKPKDIVIVGFTDHRRLSIPIKLNQGKFQYLNITGAGYSAYLENKHHDHLDLLKEIFNLDKEHYLAAIKYYELFVEQQQYGDMRKEMYESTFKNFGKYLNDKDVNYFLWDNSCWDIGEKIYEWSKKQYIEYHWSPNGHRRFLAYLLWSLLNNNTYLSFKNYHSNRKNILKHYKELKLDEYIDAPDREFAI